jgi:hypothetical protein
VNLSYREINGNWINIASDHPAEIGYNIYSPLYTPLFYGAGTIDYEFKVEYMSNNLIFDIGFPITVKSVNDNPNIDQSLNLHLSCTDCIAGEAETITWNLPLSVPITLVYTIDGGLNWAPIAVNIPNTETHQWTIPSCKETDYLSLGIRYKSSLDAYSFDVLDGFESIKEPPEDLQNGLVAYYPFNGDAEDASGNGFNGVKHNMTPTTDRFGVSNSAYLLNGSSSYIEILGIDDNFDLQDHTISAWVKWEPGASCCGGGGIFGVTNNGKTVDHYAMTCHENFFRSFINYPDSPNDEHQNLTTSFQDQNFHHIATTYNGSTRSLYLDGKLVNQIQFTEAINYGANTLAFIGVNHPGGVDWFKGVIDEVRLYNRALNCNEIGALYGECIVDLQGSLIAEYPFNGNDNDISGNGHHPIFNNATPTSDRFDNPMSAYLFDGIDDEIAIPNPFGDIFNDSDPFSISLWFETSSSKPIADLCTYYTICKSGNGGTDDDYFLLSIYDGNSLVIGNGNGAPNVISTPGINDGQFHFLFLTSTGTIMEVYLDNNLIDDFSVVPSTDPIPDNYNLVIGNVHIQECGGNRRFQGRIDDVRIYGKKVNPCEQEIISNNCIMNRTLQNLNISTSESFLAGSSIKLKNVTITPGAELTLTAPNVEVLPNNQVDLGGKLYIINENNCGSMSMGAKHDH